MTAEEAQQLITEIDKKYGAQYGTYLVPPAEQVCDEIKKIITRFANKPPEEGFTINSQGVQYLNMHIVDPYVVFVIREDKEYCGEIALTANLLRQHIEHCTKMLGYLNEPTI